MARRGKSHLRDHQVQPVSAGETGIDAAYSGGEILAALESADRYNEYLIALVLEAVAGRKELVDFGAGTGTFARRLRDRGHNVTCVEKDQGHREGLLADGFQTCWPLETLPDDSATAIYSLNVLEHIDDDLLAVRQLYRKLQRGGTLLIYVPAFPVLWSSLDDQVQHCRRYTKSSLRDLVEQAGFSIQKLSYADSLGFAAAIIFRCLRRPAAAITPTSVSFYDRWLFPVSRLVDRLAHPFLGKNVYAICRKD
jgi:SAM-dependent methyltransferase